MQNTFTKPADFWQQRDFGKKISATFEFIGAHWRPLGQVLLYLVVPVALVQGILNMVLQSQLLGTLRQVSSGQSAGGAYSFSGRFAMYSTLVQSPLYLLNNLLAVALHANLPGVDQARAEEIVAKAHETCPYSRATRGNIDVQLTVTTDAAVAA